VTATAGHGNFSGFGDSARPIEAILVTCFPVVGQCPPGWGEEKCDTSGPGFALKKTARPWSWRRDKLGTHLATILHARLMLHQREGNNYGKVFALRICTTDSAEDGKTTVFLSLLAETQIVAMYSSRLAAVW